MRLGDLIEERANLVNEMRNVLNTADEAGRDLSAEERQEYDRREERVREIESDIRRHEAAQRAEDLDLRDPSVEQPEERQDTQASYAEAFEAYTRGLVTGRLAQDEYAEMRTTLNTATDADGGYAVPEEWASLYEGLRQFGVIRSYATVITTASGGTLHIPKVTADATRPVITAEEDPIANDAETFGEVQLGAFKYARITKASEEMVQDALFDVQSFAGRRLGEDLALATAADYVSGSGTGEPEGLFTGAGNGGTLASSGSLSADALIDLKYSVIAPYRVGAVYVLNDAAIASVRKLKDSNGQYLWQPALTVGAPDVFDGNAVVAEPNVTAPSSSTANTDPVIGFGNIARAFTIRDVLGVSIKFLDQLYAENDQVGWRGKLRTDSGVVDATAFKVLHNH